MKNLFIGSLSILSMLVGNVPGLAETVSLEDFPHESYLVRNSITWYIARPISTSKSVVFNIFADGSIDNEYKALSLVVEAECTGSKRFIVKSERNYLVAGGFKQSDEEVSYTDLPNDSPFGMAHTIVCSKYYDPNSQSKVVD